MNGTVYPEWVQRQKQRGTTVKKVGNNYYLYKHSSKRVPGKKYPVPVDTYIGRITPDGIERGEKKIVASGDVEVSEFGFSAAMEQLCPSGWKEPLGKNWRDTLDVIIIRESSESYILKERKEVDALDPHIQLGAQIAMLNKRMRKEYGTDIKELKGLCNIYLVYIGGRKLISKVSQEQQALIDRLQLRLEVD